MTMHYSCDGCRGTLGPAGCPIHANSSGQAVPGRVGFVQEPVGDLAQCVEPIRDLLRYLTCKPNDVPSYNVYKAVWEAGRKALTTVERHAGVLISTDPQSPADSNSAGSSPSSGDQEGSA